MKSFLRIILPLGLAYLAMIALFVGCAGTKKLKVGAAPGGEVVEAEGLSARTDDVLSMKKASLEDARKSAVEKVVGVLISARTMVDKAITVQQNILARTDGYVKNYEILREGLQPDGLYHCKIRALVSLKEVERDLAANDLLSQANVGYPRVAIVIEASADDANPNADACQTALTEGLVAQSYPVVEPSVLKSMTALEMQMIAQGTATRQITEKLNAEILIRGNAKVSRVTANGLAGLISYRGQMSVKAIRTGSGEVVATASPQASGLDVTSDMAAEKALALLGKAAAESLSQQIAQRLAKNARITVQFKNAGSLERLQMLKDSLAKISGIGEIFVRRYNAENSEIEIKNIGTNPLQLGDTLEKDPRLNVKVTDQSQDFLVIAPR